jgi:purine-binding chemotaxis protein CheW
MVSRENIEAAEEKYLVFSILGRLYAFPSKHVGEIAVFNTVYPLPLMPDYVLGIINRYSVPYVLFDTGALLFKEPSRRGKVLIIKEDIDRIAFLIDDIADIADIMKTQLAEVERNAESGDLTEIISESFKWNNDDVFVLDIRRILNRVTREAFG